LTISVAKPAVSSRGGAEPLAIEPRPEPSTDGRTPYRRFGLNPQRAFVLPLLFMLALLALSWLPLVRNTPGLWWSLVGAVAGLLMWALGLFATAARRGRTLTVEVALRKQHYVQACAHLSVFLYWGWYWREVYDYAPLIVAQLAFAYAFDMLLSWSRRDAYALGFGPFPVIFSMNLFLWFKPDWFYLQFLLVAIGFAAKEFIRWQKDGRQAHIFNPSSFPLAVVSVLLILTHTTHLTWGPEIAETQFRPPHIYLLLFLVSLPGQFLFGVTSMTMSAVVAMYGFGLLYHAITGTYFFFETVPIAVFLGMHLLFTDPSTSPRTEGGRIMFGVLYAAGVVALAPTLGFYDKLLPVPILNLSIKLLDRIARSPAFARLDPAACLTGLKGRRRHLAYMTVWTLAFVLMSTTHGIGHSSRGYWLPEWQQACRGGRRHACEKLAQLEETYCRDGNSGWACNDMGLMLAEGRYGSREKAVSTFRRACELGFRPACGNMQVADGAPGTLQSGPPDLADYPVLLVNGQERRTDPPFTLYRIACGQGWMAACESLGIAYLEGRGTQRDPARAAVEFGKACQSGVATACASVAYQFTHGDGVALNDRQALTYLDKACKLGMSTACRWLAEACASRSALETADDAGICR
jgi:hypothetical protein